MVLPFHLGTVRIGLGDPAETLDAFWERGGRDIDTARVYPDSESAIAAWERSRGVEGGLRILTKGAHPAEGSDEPRLDRASVEEDLARSLEALDRESVEAYVLHRDDPARATADIADTLAALVSSGRVGRIGVSNWTTARVAALLDDLARIDGPALAWVSNAYGLAEVGDVVPTGPDLLALAGERGFRILAWSALSNGFFTGGRGASNPRYDTAENHRRRAVLEEVAAEYGARPVDVLARWTVVGTPAVVPILGPTGRAHVEDVASATIDASLDDAVAELDRRVRTVSPR